MPSDEVRAPSARARSRTRFPSPAAVSPLDAATITREIVRVNEDAGGAEREERMAADRMRIAIGQFNDLTEEKLIFAEWRKVVRDSVPRWK